MNDERILELARTSKTCQLNVEADPIDVTTFPRFRKIPDYNWSHTCSCGNKIRWVSDESGFSGLYGTILYDREDRGDFYEDCVWEGSMCSSCREMIYPKYEYISLNDSTFREFVIGAKRYTFNGEDISSELFDKAYGIVMDRKEKGDFDA